LLRRLERYLKRVLLAFLKLLIGSRQLPDLASNPFKRILVIRQHDQLGDMLCVVPLLRSLRQRYPDAFIALMTSPVSHEVMLHNRYVDQAINYDKREFLGGASVKLGRFLGFIRALRREKFELAIVPSTVSISATSDMFGYLSGAKYRIGAGEINGVENPSGLFFNSPVKLKWEETGHRHQTLRNLDIAHDLWLNIPDLSTEIDLTVAEIAEARVFIGSIGLSSASFVAYHPGAGKPPNRWPAERFAEAANRLSSQFNMGVVITHGPMDDEPIAAMKSNLTVPYQMIEKKKIRQVAAILSMARLVISNDTGIMHVAAAVGTPVLSLFGPTDPEQWAPIGTKHRYIVGKGGDIGTIMVEEVLAVAREMLR
jgi:ADP-heptose:LPS heptosyltransferase